MFPAGQLGTFNSRPHKEVDKRKRIMRAWQRSFQFTTSQGGRHFYFHTKILRFIFQFTTSQGGRLRFWMNRLVELYLSIHDLTRRSTASSDRAFTLVFLFQFTTSQGGRQQICVKFSRKNANILFIIHKTIALFFPFNDIFLSFHYLCPSFPVRIPWYFLCTPHPH